MIMAPPNENKMDWTGIAFSVPCCVNAFSNKSECKFAFCEDCFSKNTVESSNDGNGVNKRIRRQGRTGRQVAISTTGANKKKKGGNCGGEHTLGDLITLNNRQTDKRYRQASRKREGGWENIVTTCYQCGIEF